MARRMILRFSPRGACFRWALALYAFEQIALKGVSWTAPLSGAVYWLYRFVDLLLPCLLAFCFLEDARKHFSRYHGIVLAVLAPLSVSAYISKDPAALYSVLLILLARDLPFDRLRTSLLKSIGWALFTLILAHFLKLTVSQPVNFAYGMGYSMGMAHPNNFSTAVSAFLLLWAYGQREKPFLRTMPLLAAGALLTFCFTRSRTTLIILLLYPVMFLLLRLPYRLRGEWLVRLMYLEFFTLMLLSLLLMLQSEMGISLPGFWGDRNFLSRFTSALHLYERYGVHLFGSFIEYRSLRTALLTGQPAVILDSAYLYLLIGQGLVPLMIFLALISRAVRIMIRRRQFVLLAVIGLFLASGMMERYMLYAYVNFPLLAAVSRLDAEKETLVRPVRRQARAAFRFSLGRTGKTQYNKSVYQHPSKTAAEVNAL